MRLRGRAGRRPDHWSSPHERARVRAAERLVAPLRSDEGAWLEGHLAGCSPCRAIAAAYLADQLAIRLLREEKPDPPRDLWARTAAGIERESAARRTSDRPIRRRPATSLPAIGALSGISVVALVVVATAISGNWFGGVGPVAVGPTATLALASPDARPQPTALVVVADKVHWLGGGDNGVFAYSVADVRAVCQRDRQPDCAPFTDDNAKRVTLTAIPRFVYQSPIDDQAVVVGTDANGADAVLVVSLPAPDPAPDPTPDPDSEASTGPADSPVPPPGSTEPPGAATSPDLTIAPTDAPIVTVLPIATDSPIVDPSDIASASLAASVGPASPEASSPEPSPTAVAILTNVVIVGRAAAYSPDGAWFAFSARPSDGSVGPDIYVWHVGDLLARALTTDHASVFASWVGGTVLGSRLSPEPIAPAESAEPIGEPGASPPVEPTPEVSPSIDGAASPVASSSPGPSAITERVPQTFLLDPWTGVETPLIEMEWQPAVDPSGLVVVAWQGTVGIGVDGLVTGPATGNLVVHPFRGLLPGGVPSASPAVSPEISPDGSPSSSASPEPSGFLSPDPSSEVSASSSPQVAPDFPVQIVAAGPIVDFDARWDDTGSWLAIWIADPIDPGLGRLSLLHFDRFTGLVDRPVGAPQDVTALPGFSIGLGRLAWASPPGQSGEGSRIQIAAWTADEVGAIESVPVQGAIVVQ